MKFKILVFTLCVTGFSGCSFNKLFLHPTKIPREAKSLTMAIPGDTTKIVLSGDAYQPTFLKNGKDTLIRNYTIKSVVFEGAKENKLNGWMLKPKNTDPQITLIHFHGNAGSIFGQYQAVAPLLDYGFQVFVFDYSGFGLSEGKATRKNVMLDANAALSYAKDRPDIKGTKLVIYGQSLGGHLSAVVATEQQHEIDGLVIEGAFSSHGDMAAEFTGFLGRILVAEQYNGFKALRNYHKPVLIIHSTEDETVPFKMGKKLFENANQPKQFFEIEHCHICGPRFYAQDIAAKINNMLVSQ